MNSFNLPSLFLGVMRGVNGQQLRYQHTLSTKCSQEHPDLHECYDTAGTHVAPINDAWVKPIAQCVAGAQ